MNLLQKVWNWITATQKQPQRDFFSFSQQLKADPYVSDLYIILVISEEVTWGVFEWSLRLKVREHEKGFVILPACLCRPVDTRSRDLSPQSPSVESLFWAWRVCRGLSNRTDCLLTQICQSDEGFKDGRMQRKCEHEVTQQGGAAGPFMTHFVSAFPLSLRLTVTQKRRESFIRKMLLHCERKRVHFLCVCS